MQKSTIQHNTKAERKMAENNADSSISLSALRAELYTHRKAVKYIKSQIKNLHLEMQKNQEKVKEDPRALQEEIFLELAA